MPHVDINDVPTRSDTRAPVDCHRVNSSPVLQQGTFVHFDLLAFGFTGNTRPVPVPITVRRGVPEPAPAFLHQAELSVLRRWETGAAGARLNLLLRSCIRPSCPC